MISTTSKSGVKISIIIVTYNSGKYLAKCVSSILKIFLINNCEIIVIDNDSSDNTLEILNLFSNSINIIQNNTNVGFAKACNQGIKIGKGKYIFLLNPDTELLNDSVSIFYNYFEKAENQKSWCTGAQLFDEKNRASKSFGRFPNLLDVFAEQLGIKGIFLKSSYIQKTMRNPKFIQPVEVPYVMGCNMFIRRSVFDDIGLFDERFFLNFEETELAWRAKNAGYKCMLLPEARIIHHSGKSFTDLKSYLSHLWYGQLMFFKITQTKFVFYLAKVLHLFGSLLRLLFKLDNFYWTHAKKIWSIKL